MQDVTRALQAYAAAVAPRDPRPVDPQVAASAGFELAEKLLRAQRDYVITTIELLTATREAVTRARSPTRDGQAASRRSRADRTESQTARPSTIAATTTCTGVSASMPSVEIACPSSHCTTVATK